MSSKVVTSIKDKCTETKIKECEVGLIVEECKIEEIVRPHLYYWCALRWW